MPDPVGVEFRQISDQIRLGHPPEQALWDAAQRVGTPELKFLVVTLSIQRETGGNLAETLENLDNILRRRRQMQPQGQGDVVRSAGERDDHRRAAVHHDGRAVGGEQRLYVAALHHRARPSPADGGAGMLSLGVGIMTKMVKFDI